MSDLRIVVSSGVVWKRRHWDTFTVADGPLSADDVGLFEKYMGFSLIHECAVSVGMRSRSASQICWRSSGERQKHIYVAT